MAEGRDRCGCCNFVWDHFTFVTRVWGIVTAVGLWGIGIEVVNRGTHAEIGLYLLITAILVTFLETLFILDKCATRCCKEESCMFKCWSIVTWIDNWKRSILYVILSIVCFLNPTTVWLAVISGIMLLVSAILHGVHTIKARSSGDQGASGQDYDRFEEAVDEHEDTATAVRTAGSDIRDQVFRDDDDAGRKDFEYNPFKDEDKERKRSPSFDLGTGSDGLHVGTLEV